MSLDTAEIPAELTESVAPVPIALAAALGCPLGAIFGAATSYASGMWDDFWTGVLLGALIGPLVGTLVARIRHARSGTAGCRDIGAITGVVLGLVPAAVILLKLVGAVGPMLIAGSALISPTAGLLLGALFDRAIDEWRNRQVGATIFFSFLGLGICSALISGLNSISYGPAPEKIADIVHDVVVTDYREDPLVRDVVVKDVRAVRDGRRTYTGTFQAIINNAAEEYEFHAQDDGDVTTVEWAPRH